MFSSLTLRNCAVSEVDETPFPITLKASVTFPSSRWTNGGYEIEPTVTSWAARPLTDSGHLDLTVDTKVAEGGIGFVYTSRINSGVDSSGQDILTEWPAVLPHELCVKIAKPQRCRSLAREAWFYEQLSEVQGIATARCYGFYTVTFGESTTGEASGLSVRPWKELNRHPHRIPPDDEDTLSSDYLADDAGLPLYTDEHGFKQNSPWNKWRPSGKEPLLAVLVLEKLGRHYLTPEEEKKLDFKKQRRALRRLVQDIGALGVLHCDLTAFNFLRVQHGQQSHCPRHNCVHQWRIVDFSHSDMIDPMHSAAMDLNDARDQASPIGRVDCGFWGHYDDY